MRLVRRSQLESLGRESRELQRRITALLRHRQNGIPDLPADGSVNVFEVVLGSSLEQHEEILRQRLADKSYALSEALEQLRDGMYGICRECGCTIPWRRLEALPTATLCVRCQEQREAVRTAA